MIEELQEYNPQQRGKAWVCDDIPNKDYHAGVGVSSSFIRRFGESQLHAIEHQQETTPAMRFGTAAHSLLVEGQEAFDKEVVVITGSPYTKANKELKEEYEKRGLTVIKEADVESIHNMKDSMVYEGNSYLNARGKVAESSFYWYEDAVLCKCRPDLICPPLNNPDSKDEIVIVDYKTTQSVEPYTFANSVKKFRYDLQASYYRRGIEAAGYKVTDFMFVAQEKTYPYASKVFRMTKEQMDFGWSIMEAYLDNYKEYEKGKPVSIYNSPNVIDLVL
jgi:hypothetical protein